MLGLLTANTLLRHIQIDLAGSVCTSLHGGVLRLSGVKKPQLLEVSTV